MCSSKYYFALRRSLTSIVAVGSINTFVLLSGCGNNEDQNKTNDNNPNNENTAAATCVKDDTTFVSENYSQASAYEGGKIYDAWWEIEGTEPTGTFSLFSTQTTNNRSGSDTWRCKECHGWDYKGKDGAYNESSDHYTGFIGVFEARGKQAIEVFCAIKAGTESTPQHHFEDKLTDKSILKLTKFITDSTGEGIIDTDEVIGSDKKVLATAGTDSNGLYFFTDSGSGVNCSRCHGLNGDDSLPEESLGTLADENPWELLHKIRFGQPDAPEMPSLVENSKPIFDAASIVMYAQSTLPSDADSATEPAPVGTDLVRGGLLYDDWVTETGNTSLTQDNPLWALRDTDNQPTNTSSGTATWRCKECHGWDYKGRGGAYNDKSDHYTGFGGIRSAVDNKTEDQIFNLLKNGYTNPLTNEVVHNFSTFSGINLMSDDDLHSLAKFVKEGTIDTDQYILRDLKWGQGDKVNGQYLYTYERGQLKGDCSICHGTDGKDQPADNPLDIGVLARDNPWEVLHKIRFGQPDSQMVGLQAYDEFTIQDAADIMTYVQSLQ
jgi:mono/diheme cytochrome c family protein/ribosomal protein L37AE/L43A